MPEYKGCLDQMPGVPLQDMWTDVPPIGIDITHLAISLI